MGNRNEALALYDERFCRMWEFYLAACEAAFRFQDVAVFQIQCARRIDTVPVTRDYIFERIHDLRMQESQSVPGEPSFESLPRRKAR
jgi:cyclopropane-fatty-acyl-phospholipid synthase